MSGGAPPDVSVVLLTYNHERYVAQAIESVLAQADVALELLIVEDCSTDATRAIVRAYAERDPARIRLFLSPRNRNANAVLAEPMAAARGRYVATLDGDDYWTSPDKLRLQAAYLDAHPTCALCFHEVATVDEEGRPVGDAADAEAAAADGPEPARRYGIADMLEHNVVPGCSPVMRRAAIGDLPPWFYDAEYGDWPLYLHVARSGTMDRLPEVLGAYRVHGAGYWTQQRRRQQLEGRLRFARLLRDVFRDEHGGRLAQVEAELRARLARACAEERDAAAAAAHLAAIALVAVRAPRQVLGGGRWRALARQLLRRPAAAARTAPAAPPAPSAVGP